MARFHTDFSEYADDALPSDWTAIWNDPTDWRRIASEYGLNPTYSPALQKDNTASGNKRAGCTWDDIGALPSGDLDVRAILQARNYTNCSGILFRASGATGSENGYAVYLSTFGDGLRLGRMSGGAWTAPATDPFNVVDLTPVNVRAQLLVEAPNVRIRAKIWDIGDPEPDAWGIDYVDASPLANAPMGAWQFAFGDGQYLYEIWIGTDGDSAIVGLDEGGVGDAPSLSVDTTSRTTAVLATDTLSEYILVNFRVYAGAVIEHDSTFGGFNRFQREVENLTPGDTYVGYCRVERAAGWSPWSAAVEFTMPLIEQPEDITLGCPPSYTGIHVNADANPPTNRYGIGWFTPLPGEPMRGTVELIFRWPFSGVQWDFELSGDLGATYGTVIEADVEADGAGADGDRLVRYRATFDTTAHSDGQDYRVRAVSDSDTIESLSFPIDNSNEVHWWKQNYGGLEGRFGRLWAEEGANFWGTPNGEKIWWRGADGGIGALRGQGFSCYADLEIPECRGADITVRFYIWSGEGGWLQLQGRDDTEGIYVGVGLFAKGETPESQEGLFLGVENPTTFPAYCCDRYLTSGLANPTMFGSVDAGDPFARPWGYLTGDNPLWKMFFKANSLPYWHGLDLDQLVQWPYMTWREGPEPGNDIRGKRYSCVRRYEAYSMRVRCELNPADDHILNVKYRLDGLGVDEPASGYWHYEQAIDRGEPWPEGAVGLASKQIAQQTYGDPQGARVFLSWSALPLEPGYEPPDIPPDEPEWWNPPEPGQPCTLVLQVFDEDRERVKWEVGTDPLHTNPYLMLPAHYGEQEIDPVQGSATIGQVEVTVVDRRQRAGDQDSGWMTERLAVDSVGGIQGRRCRLLRYISVELGWVVIADGPAGPPTMDASYSAFKWTIRDTRETERKVKAFVKADTSWLLPMGVEPGFGLYQDINGDDQWLVSPAEPLIGEYHHDTGETHPIGYVDLYDYWDFDALPWLGNDEVEPGVVVTSAIEERFIADAEELGDPYPVLWTWPELEILWRLEGSGTPWNVVQPTDLNVEGRFSPLALANKGAWWRNLVNVWDAKLADGTEVRAVSEFTIRGYEATGTFPTDGDSIEVAIRYAGAPTEDFPLHIEGMTPGQFLKAGYDGEYSYPDPVTGEFVPTAIRYNEADLLQMGIELGEGETFILAEDGWFILAEDGSKILEESAGGRASTILLRITEPVDDFRAWAEEFVYAPTGWIPALNNDGEISPKSQVPPDDATGLIALTNAITEPSPDWGAGERVVNVLSFIYPRWIRKELGEVDAIDLLEAREITQEYRDEASVTRNGLQVVELKGDAFSAIGDSYGKPILNLESEQGTILTGLRRLYVFDRFRNATPTIEVAVRRDVVASLRAGDFVAVDLSWFPDYVPQPGPGD
jgi:hypothetical protein